jgi:hypothetical protein
MTHAQRLLPLEQLLSQAGVAGASPARGPGQPAATLEPRRPDPPLARSSNVSPFAADSARKGGPKPELSGEGTPKAGPRLVAAGTSASVILGAAAPADVELLPPETHPQAAGAIPESQATDSGEVRMAVLNALTDAGHRILAALLERGEWQVEGNELILRPAASAAAIDMSLGVDAKRLAVATASGVLGRAVKLRVVPGGPAVEPQATKGAPANGGGRNRAEQDPIVRRIKEKFGAEIRTIIDYREKR